MASIKQLGEQRAELAEQIRKMTHKIHQENRDFDAEERQHWKNVNENYNRVQSQLESQIKLEQLEKDAEQDPSGMDDIATRTIERPPVDARKDRRETREDLRKESDLALRSWMNSQLGQDIPLEGMIACRRMGINPNSPQLDVQLLNNGDLRILTQQFKRAWAAGTDNVGGSTVPAEDMVRQIEISLLEFGGMREVSEVIRTDTGVPLTFPTVNDTAATGRIETEAAALNTDSGTPFSDAQLSAYKYSSDIVQVSIELLQDSAIDIAALLGGLLGTRIARLQNAHFTTGTGTLQPQGFVTNILAGTGATESMSISAGLTYTNMVNLLHDLDPAYRRQGARWMMNDTTLAAVRTITDSNGSFVWQPSLQLGDPDRILGYPLTINQDMDALGTTTAAEIIAFGAFSKYKIRDVRTIRLRRLVELYAANDQEGFVALMRSDGILLDAGTDPIVLMDTAA